MTQVSHVNDWGDLMPRSEERSRECAAYCNECARPRVLSIETLERIAMGITVVNEDEARWTRGDCIHGLLLLRAVDYVNLHGVGREGLSKDIWLGAVLNSKHVLLTKRLMYTR
jgi:hypothetical protein